MREFSGSERTVADYLLAEVLERQPAEVRELLLRTSILERVSGPLADVLTGGSGSERILQQLEDANAFVASLDAGRSWFRYHHLFADLLRLELRRTAPAIVAPLHRAAAALVRGARRRRRGDPPRAGRGGLAARRPPARRRLRRPRPRRPRRDPARAARRVPARRGRRATPELALVFAKARLFDGALDESAAYLAVAERLAGAVPAERRRRFDLELAGGRAGARAPPRRPRHRGARRCAAVEAALAAQPAGDWRSATTCGPPR